MNDKRKLELVNNKKTLYLISATVFLTLFLRFGFFGLLTAYHYPILSFAALATLLLTLIARLFISLLKQDSIKVKKASSALTAIEWICWTFWFTHPFLLVFTYLRMSAKLPTLVWLQMIDHLAVLFVAFLLAMASLFAILKNRRFLYTLLFYVSIELALISLADSLLPETRDFGPKEEMAKAICKIESAEPILSYPCKDNQMPWCALIFEHSSPYKTIYHAPTNQLIVSGGFSELLLFLELDSGKINKILKFNDAVKYLTYDKTRDKALVQVRKQGCVFEVDPYSYKIGECLFKDLHIKEEFQLGCLNKGGDLLIYNVDTIGIFLIKDYRTKREEVVKPILLTGAYGIVCHNDEAFISSGCPSPLLPYGLIKVKLKPNFKIAKKKGFILPAMEIEYDSKRKLLYIARPTPGKVDIYRANDLKKLGSIKAPSGTRELALDEKRGYLYAGSFGSGEIVKINLVSKQIEKRYKVGPLLRDLTFADELDEVFATSACGVYKLKE